MTDLKTALRAAVEALPGATKGPYATPLVDDTQLVGRGGVEIAVAVGDYEDDYEAMTRDMAFLAASANLARHAPELLAMVEEVERLRAEVAAARTAALEEAAGVADGWPADIADISMDARVTAHFVRDSIAAAIRALKSNPQPAGGGGPTIPAQDTETNQ